MTPQKALTSLTGLLIIGGLWIACGSSDDSPPGYGIGGSQPTGGGGSGKSGAGGAGGGSSVSDASDAKTADDSGCVKPKGATCNPDGGYRCPVYASNVCDDTCVNTMTDPAYCGTCTTKCPAGATCNGGKCGASPTALVAAAPGCSSLNIAAAGGVVYRTDKGHGTVKGISTAAGGATVTVASNQMGPTKLIVDGGSVYWINGGSKTVSKAGVGGDSGAPTVLATAAARADAGVAMAPDITAIAIFSGSLYYATAENKQGNDLIYGIYKMPVSGGAATLIGLAQQNGIPRALAIDPTFAYYTTDIHNDVEFMTLVATGDAGVGFNARELDDLAQKMYRVAESQGSLLYDAIFVSNQSVYWANGGTVLVGKPDGKRTGVNVASAANSGIITGFTVGSSNVYFGEDHPFSQNEFMTGMRDHARDGFVEKAPLAAEAGADVAGIFIARDQPSPNSFAVDATNVYWSAGPLAADAGAEVANACAIMKLPL